MTRPLTPAERQKRRRSRGVAVSAVLVDPEAITALRLARAAYGATGRALEAVLRDWLDGEGPGRVPAPGPDTARRPRGHDRPGGAASAPDSPK